MQNRKFLKLDDIPRYEALIEGLKVAYQATRRGKHRLRDLALVATIVFTGCRLGEALKLKVEDIDFKSRTVRIHQEKKGRTFYRIVPVPSNLFWDIMEWYLRRFPSKDMLLFPISDRQARNIVYKFSKRFLRRKYRPHAFRHAYAIFVSRTTRDLETVRRLLGHSGYTWLKCYLDYTQEDLLQDLEKAFTQLEHI